MFPPDGGPQELIRLMGDLAPGEDVLPASTSSLEETVQSVMQGGAMGLGEDLEHLDVRVLADRSLQERLVRQLSGQSLLSFSLLSH